MNRATLLGLTGLLSLGGLAVAVQPEGISQEIPMPPLRPDQVAFRALYKELVETNTTPSVGSCTLAAERMAAHLKAAGFSDKDVAVFTAPGHPKEGGLTAVLAGTSKSARPMLLLGHLDVVEAKREDWTRDPFILVEENGYFYARGVYDMKDMDATWVDALMRFKQSGYRPKRSIKLALTCGEEGLQEFDGAQWLSKNHPELVSAAFALNEGGGGITDGHGKMVEQDMVVSEKAYQSFLVETFNEGGHSSIPIRDNAIYELAEALSKVRDYTFPANFSDTTKAYFGKVGASRDDELGHAMVALSHNTHDAAAIAIVSKDRIYNSILRTTCVATLLEGGHADNALPQHAKATVNCRIFPGETLEHTQAALVSAIADPGVKVTMAQPISPVAVPSPLDPKILGPAEILAAKYFPGVPVVPSMATGAGDGIYLEAIGIPVYGVPGNWGDPDGNGAHGLNERESIRSVFTARDYWTELVKLYADSD